MVGMPWAQLWRLLVASADPDFRALRREAEGEKEAKARQLGGSQNGSAAAMDASGSSGTRAVARGRLLDDRQPQVKISGRIDGGIEGSKQSAGYQ